MSEHKKALKKVNDLAGVVNAAWSFAETDPKKVKFYLDRAASLVGDLRGYVETQEKREEGESK